MTTLVVSSSLSTSSSFLFSKREGPRERLGGGMCFPLRKGTPRTTLPRRHHHHRNNRKRTATSIPRAAFLRDFLKASSSKTRKEEDRNAVEIFEGEVNEILESARAAVFPTTAEKKTRSGDAEASSSTRFNGGFHQGEIWGNGEHLGMDVRWKLASRTKISSTSA